MKIGNRIEVQDIEKNKKWGELKGRKFIYEFKWMQEIEKYII